MADGMKRREFLRLTGTFLVTAKLAGCGGDDAGGDADAAVDGLPTGIILFPQGVASGDPTEASVVLWTRAVKSSGTGDVTLKLEVATDEAFTAVVAMQTVTAMASVDNTVRVIVTDLAADTIYYYRFSDGPDAITGRTRTAPAPTPTSPSASPG